MASARSFTERPESFTTPYSVATYWIMVRRNSQHLQGQAADIRPKDPQQFQRLVDFLSTHPHTDKLLTARSGWLHISWNPFGNPRHYIRIGYYK